MKEGELLRTKVYGGFLEGNLLGDSPEREVLIYLPPGYDESRDERYPSLYLLHGYGVSCDAWLESDFTKGFSVKESMDRLIRHGDVEEMIVVMPDCRNRFGGCWHTDSPVTGNWEKFITEDLTAYVDANYRTVPDARARGIAGHSMGAYGALKSAMKRADMFRSVYAMSASNLTQDKLAVKRFLHVMEQVDEADEFDELKLISKLIISKSAAFAPDPDNPPFYFEPLYEMTGDEVQFNEEVWEKWQSAFLANNIERYKENMMQLKMVVDCGTADPLFQQNAEFSEALRRAGIDCRFNQHEGNHINRIKDIFETSLLPFFSGIFRGDAR